MYCIYVIKNKINNKMYIGQTGNLKSRWNKHISVAEDMTYNHPLYNSMRKYGIDNFTIEVLNPAESIKECNYLEEFWVEELQTTSRDIGYNIQKGGKHSEMAEETRQKISEAMTGEKNPFFGKTHSEETKQKIAKARTGTTTAEEVKQKMSDAKKGEGNGMFGKSHTQESKGELPSA